MRALKFCGIALASGLVMGASAGSYIGRTMGAGQAILWEMSAAAGYGQLALLQSAQTDTDHARAAMLSFTNFSKSMSKLRSAQGDTALLIDTGRAYLQLAAIEELAGNQTLPHRYVLAAQQSFKSMGREIPEEELNKQVTKIVSTAPPKSPPSDVPPPVHVRRASAP
jgi:hypothetical protein